MAIYPTQAKTKLAAKSLIVTKQTEMYQIEESKCNQSGHLVCK